MRSGLFLVLFFAALSGFSQSTDADDRAVRKIVADLWQAWNAHPPNEIVKDFAVGHDHVNVFGGHEDTASLLAMYERNFAPGGPWDQAGAFVGTGVLNLRFVRSDFAVAIVGAVERAHAPAVTFTWMFHKKQGRCQVTNFHNTADVDVFGLPSGPQASHRRPPLSAAATKRGGRGGSSEINRGILGGLNRHDAKAMVATSRMTISTSPVFAGFWPVASKTRYRF